MSIPQYSINILSNYCVSTESLVVPLRTASCNVKILHFLPTEYIYVFGMDLGTKRSYIHIQQ